MPEFSADLLAGAHNLLVNCGEAKAGQSIAIIHEDPRYGWYDLDAPNAVAAVARTLGANVTMLAVEGLEHGTPPSITAAIDAHDMTVFFARIGDQDRFAARDPAKVCVMSYARTGSALASAYGRLDHAAAIALKDAVGVIMQTGGEIETTCPLGTRLRGKSPAHAEIGVGEVTIRRFPMGVPQPIEALNFAGEVILASYLTPTGSQYYEPASLALPTLVTALVQGNVIQDIMGDEATVHRVRNHYETIASALGIDPYYVHSWHAGLHPGCRFDAYGGG